MFYTSDLFQGFYFRYPLKSSRNVFAPIVPCALVLRGGRDTPGHPLSYGPVNNRTLGCCPPPRDLFPRITTVRVGFIHFSTFVYHRKFPFDYLLPVRFKTLLIMVITCRSQLVCSNLMKYTIIILGS